MGLLEKLWDDTLAGPHPDSGLGKLRKFNTFSPRGKDNEGMGGRSEGEEAAEEVKVTRSIMIMKPPGYQQTAGSAPASPAGSTPPVSPFSGSRSGAFRFRRRSTSDANEKATNEDGPSGSTPPP
ncbi:dormancy-associated protein homolog 3 isoform X2 [Silene latifolia]|uniref:dormancy-associated protein homolog 3 isoform X2 n=1 Tax=Silene latifolia TaxID=37657 RepID=UPI003D76B695